MKISKKLILKKTNLEEQYVEKVEQIFLNKGFLIDKPRNKIFLGENVMSVPYDETVHLHLSEVDKVIYLMKRGFQEPDNEGNTNNGVVGVNIKDFLNNGDIEELEFLYQSIITDIKTKGAVCPNA